MHSPDALHKLGDYDSWVSTLGFPLARLANEQPECEDFYRGLFMKVSAAAPNYDQAAAEEKWDDLYGAADQDREVKSSWRSLRHFARQHGYVDPLPELPIGLGDGKMHYSASNAGFDPLRFTNLPVKDAVARINSEFFVLRSSGKIYRQGADGELNALPKQDFKTALGGRWVEISTATAASSAAQPPMPGSMHPNAASIADFSTAPTTLV